MSQPDAETVAVIAEVCEFIRADPEHRPTLAALGKRTGWSAAHFQRVFKRVVGVSPRQFADACRLDRLKTGLKEGDSVTTAMFAAGYGSSSRLYEKAGAQLGMTPGEYRKGGAQAIIRYSTTACDLGRVLLAATERGVCAVALGETDLELERFLRTEFPAAKLSRDEAGLAGSLEKLLQQLAGGPHLDLPLDVRATAFQRRVWEELRRIPRGETRTYQQVAEAIGAPTAARAVARACATNPASLVIPCHRVVGTDGSLRGYRWGVKRKKKLLEDERKQD
jgi:AraC family transcriptional regulator of adaptative response/methylated-DNA-[protein]-cysteine methyltransferase